MNGENKTKKGENMTRANTIIWHEISGKPGDELPDVDLEVLVFDGELDDTVKAALDDSYGEPQWTEQVTGEPLPSPQWWAEVPVPKRKP
jgi:hypothetical protein